MGRLPGSNGEQVSHRKPSLSKSWQWNVDRETNLGRGWTFERKHQQNTSKSLWLFDQEVLGSVVPPTDHGSIKLRDDSSCFLRHNKSLWVFFWGLVYVIWFICLIKWSYLSALVFLAQGVMNRSATGCKQRGTRILRTDLQLALNYLANKCNSHSFI